MLVRTPSSRNSRSLLVWRAQPLWKTVWQFLTTLNVLLLYDPAIVLLGIYSQELKTFVVVQLLSRVQLFVTPWTAAHQTPLSFTVSQSLQKFMCIEMVMLSNHLILWLHFLLLPSIFPSIRVFSSEKLALCTRWSKYWASASVLPVNIQGWFSLGLTGLISLQSKGL